jgi:hypothetical protein
MRPALLLLLAGAISILFCGCAFMSDEDREFYGRGWVNPKELDTPVKHHAVPDPESGSDPGAVSAGVPVDPIYQDDERVPAPLNGAQ